MTVQVAFSGCGWYGPSSGNFSSPQIPLNVCADFGVDSTAESKMYQCDAAGNLKLKFYDGHGCNESAVVITDSLGADSDQYSCDEGECYDRLILETYLNCQVLGGENSKSCSCGSSSVALYNVNVCIAQGDGSFIVLCNSQLATFKYYTDQYCEVGEELEFKPKGCDTVTGKNYVIRECTSSAKTAVVSAMAVVLSVLCLIY
eukprot:CAMPEP_0197057374 /NCGR_PEP_ID=MMETSP1384-20130603/96545_1 /TAXON_ID=29189 /ORGANISM="Ammonia sp." /LENGTH=201 /DNA_ID=CAMNT_0042491773 /DNA_START=62 /DNA_END=667 /DNA_ORIENTATION=+